MAMNEQQRKIAEQTEGLMRVDAGPGTGKTFTIVQRYLEMVKKGVGINDILMVTFTRNAAEEMGDRLKTGLKEYAGSLPEGDLRERLLHSVGEVRASTFDSFCMKVVLDDPSGVSEFFGIDEMLSRGAKLVENDTLNLLHFENFYRSFIKRHGDRYRRGTDLPAIAADHVPELFDLIMKLMSRGIIPLKDDEWFLDGAEKLRGQVHTLKTMLVRKNSGKGGLYSKFRGKATYAREFEDREAFTDEELEDISDEDRDLLGYFVHDVYLEYIRRSVRDNRLTFSLSALFAFAALYQNQYCRDRNSVRYMMVDEFQDTNEMQMMICLMLLKEPNLCVVGDWKQGIYGFRFVSIDNITHFDERAEVLCRKLNRDGEQRVRFAVRQEDVVTIPLKENYRSTPLVLDAAFDALYASATKTEKVPKDPNITYLESKMEDVYGDRTALEVFSAKTEEEEMACIANQITQYLFSGRYTIVEDGVPRAPRFSDITVLFRNTKSCNDLYEYLRGERIPAYLQGDMEIMSSRPGKLALAWLRYINDPTDRRGLVTIMVDSGLSMAQIDRVFREAAEARDNGDTYESALPVWIVKEREFLMNKRKRPNDLLTCMFAFHRIGEDNPAEADMAQAIVNVVARSYADSLMTVPDIIRLIEDDIAQGTKYNVDAVLDRDAVMIQTMHKSKGLEYPIVIVGCMKSRTMPSTNGDKSVFRYSDLTGLRVTKEYAEYPDDDGTVRCGIFKSWRFDALSQVIKHDYSEERRLLFVALSRAKQYITMTWHGEMSNFMTDYVRKHGLKEAPQRCEGDITSKRSYSLPPEIPAYSKRRKNLGVHDIMTYVPGSALIGDDSERGIQYGREVHEAAQQMVSGKKYDESLPEVPYIRKVLDGIGEGKMFAEKECALPIGNVTLRGVIDLLVDHGDRCEIHDWKTDTDDRNSGSYRLQLSVYYHAVTGATGSPADCYIDYVSQGRSEKVEPMTIPEIEEYVRKYYKSASGTSE